MWQNQFDAAGQPQFDGLIITGDLATTGDQGDLEAAYYFVDAAPVMNTYLSQAGSPTLGFWKQALELLPGNHDRYRSALGMYLPGGKRFDRVFCPQLIDSNLLAEAAEQAGVSAILCGHSHESKIKPLSATTTVFA